MNWTEDDYMSPEQEREQEAREECKRRGLDPDDDAADAVQVWMVVAQELRERTPACCPADPCVCEIVGRTECIHHGPLSPSNRAENNEHGTERQ